jgi:FkbM family methyltransferase
LERKGKTVQGCLSFAIINCSMTDRTLTRIDELAMLTRQEMEAICTKAVRSYYLGDHLQLCKILSRYKIYLDTRDIGIAPNILMDGYWESWITKFIAQQVKPGMVCIDAGANFGYYSLVLAELAGKEGKCIAVEPNSYLCRLMSHTNKVNEFHFEIVSSALADTHGEVTLSIPALYWGGATIRSEKVDDEVITEQVGMITMDSLIDQFHLRQVDFIKMDCEGVEPLIFKGMEKILNKNPSLKMVMEYSPFMYKDAAAFTDFLFQRFQVGEIKGDSTVLTFTESDKAYLLNLKDHVDLFLCRKTNE